MFCFCCSKSRSNIMKIVLILSISIYFKKTFRVNKYKKQICYKKHKPLFFFNMITDSFYQRNGEHQNVLGNASAKTYYISIVKIVFVLIFIKLLINEKSFGKSFSFSFAAKYFDKNKYLFEKLSNLYIVLCHFLML